MSKDIKLLFKLTIPIFLELILQVLLGNIDKIMVRNDFVANAINQANSIIDMLTVSISILAASSLILINQYKGAKELEKEKKIYSIAFYFNILLSLFIGICLLIFAPYILQLMKINPESFNDAVIYLRICGGGLFLQAIILTSTTFLRSNAFVLEGFIISTCLNVLNVGLNALFLYVLKLPSITAVALGTVISRGIGCIVVLILLLKLTKIKLSVSGLFHSSFKELKKLLKISIPSSGESLSYSASQIVILTIINIIGLTINYAAPIARTYVNIVLPFSFIFTSSISQAMQILLGRYLGARQTDDAENLIKKTLSFAVLSSIIISITLAIFSTFIFKLFSNDNEVIKLCAQIMWIEVLLEIGRAVNITLVRALQTSGDVIFPTALAIIFCWIVAVIGSYILGVTFKLGILGIWIAMSIDELSRAFIFIIRLNKGKWKHLNLVK